MESYDVALARIYDPGRGPFCDTDKQGNPLPLPPVQREPNRDREHNPRASRHRDKTNQDYQARDKRERVTLNNQQRAWIETNKPTRSADYVRMPR